MIFFLSHLNRLNRKCPIGRRSPFCQNLRPAWIWRLERARALPVWT